MVFRFDTIKTINIQYVNSNEQLADIFITALPKDRFQRLRIIINCID